MTTPGNGTSRRTFLHQSGLLLTGATTAVAAPRPRSINEQLRVAAVGVNGMGWSDLSNVGSHPSVRFTAFCDIDQSRFDRAAAAFEGVRQWQDYRRMFDDAADQIDAVIVSTPDHMHASIAMQALALGKHVYCQKPLTHTVWEARQMRLLAEQKGVTTQMGNQIHSHQAYRTGVRLIQDGAIGKVTQVHSWVGVQGRQYCNRTDRPPASAVPAGVDWNLWLGAAPERPFAADVYHPFKWRDWQDFGSGALGDFGCHILDPVFTALGIRNPLTVTAEHSGTNSEVWPGPETVTWEFAGTDLTSERIQVIWRDGGLQPPLELAALPADATLPKSGSLFIGEKGNMVLPHVGMPLLFPAEKYADYDVPEIAGSSHWHDWVDAALAGKQTTDGFSYAGPLTETVQLGNVAARVPGSVLKWNAEQMTTGNAAADAMLTKHYRKGFEVAAVSG